MVPNLSLLPLMTSPGQPSLLAGLDEPVMRWMTVRIQSHLRGVVLPLDGLASEVVGRCQSENIKVQSTYEPLTEDSFQDQFLHIAERIDTILSIRLLNPITLANGTVHLSGVLNTNGRFIGIMPASVGLYKELSQGARVWAAQNVDALKNIISHHFKILQGRCFLIKLKDPMEKEDSTTNAGSSASNIDHVPVFNYTQNLVMLQPGAFLWFVAQKRENKIYKSHHAIETIT